MVMNNGSPYTGLVNVVLTLVAIGLVIGVTLTDTEWLNPHSSEAEVRALELENEKKALELTSYKEIQAAQIQAEKEKISLGIEAERRAQEQKLILARWTNFILLTAAAFSLLIISIGLTLFLVGRARSYPAPNTAHTWRDPIWRAEQIRIARERERKARKAQHLHRSLRQAQVGSNGGHTG